MVIVIAAALGITTANLINPWLVRELIQIIRVESGAAAVDRVTTLAVTLAVVFGLRALFRFLYSYIAHVMAYSFVGDMRVVLYSHLQRLSARFFADQQTGELLKRVISDTQDIEPLIAHYIPDMVVNVLLLFGVGFILLSLNPTLALLTLLPMPLLFSSTLFFGKRMRKGFKDASKRLGTLVGVVQDNLIGIKEIQIFTQEPREYERINALSTSTIKTRLYALKMQAFLVPSIEFLTALGTVIVVLFGGHAALGSRMPVEDLVAFVLYLGIFYQPITVMAQMNEMLHVAIAGADRVVEVLDIQPDIDDAPNCIEPGRLRGEIAFNNVRFDYNAKMPTLHDISFQVQP